MSPRELDISRDYLSRLKSELDKTLLAYRKTTELRARKIEQDMEQIQVYLELLENRHDKIKLSPAIIKKLHGVLSWEPKNGRKNSSHRKQQDQLERHFVELQKVLVALISKRFKY